MKHPRRTPTTHPLRRAFAAAALASLLGAAGCRTADAPHPHPHPTPGGATFIPMEEAPVYHELDGYDPRWRAHVEDGVELARAFWGSYGPVHVWVAGREEHAEPTDDAKEAFLTEYCRLSTSVTDRLHAECHCHASERFLDVVERGDAEAYLSWAEELEQPTAELVFLNVHRWFFEEDPVPDPVLRGVHEYTHVFQKAFAHMPIWLMEGCAVFAEAWIPWTAQRCDEAFVTARMDRSMREARRATKAGLTIADMEGLDSAPLEAHRFYRELAYDAGAWGTVLLVHLSPSKSVSALRDEFFPMVDELGWERALCRYLGIENKYWFYEAFDAFMEGTAEQQHHALRELRP